MEKPLEDVSFFEKYQNRQVVLNYYEDELMWNRDGFVFERIQLLHRQLIFYKKDGRFEVVSLEDYPSVSVNEEFQHYFTLRNAKKRLDIYFPY